MVYALDGMMSADDAIKQMISKPARYTAEEIVAEQQNVYMNTEFKEISPKIIKHV